ncbi:hypothetical protein NW767_010801 [Fusarium falciforme]|uniref:Cytochrome P450 monooxygenase n=1 Tax=Fusarium falciforme TaxID=195108 RepID=A0A9W8UZ36_9HYPO|nr:hypothetical protein NW755_007868 [Fusarium falciforme]KAJ4191894.1 hypothetical protein NW767_010801 [Fusarium falciforme]
MGFFVPTITYVTNTLLVDEQLSSDSEWVRHTSEFAVNRYAAADDVRQWPPYISALVAPFIPSVRRLHQQRRYVMEKMTPLYENLRSQGMFKKKSSRKGARGYEWLWSGSPDEVTLQDFSDTMMRTLIASIHTTAKTMSVALVDMLTRPELLEELKTESREAVNDFGGVDLERLIKLDCFLKESQRLSPMFLLTMNRIVTQNYEFKCSSLKLPKGTMIMAPAAAIATDPDTFQDPNTFDGHRYLRMREVHKEAASSLVLGMSTIDSLGFGLGNQACPGRFLAVNNLKLMLAKLLVDWDLSIAKDGMEYTGSPPKRECNDFSVVPPQGFNMCVRKL